MNNKFKVIAVLLAIILVAVIFSLKDKSPMFGDIANFTLGLITGLTLTVIVTMFRKKKNLKQ
ncbi:MAG: hypothetical protein JXB34_12375 [Bacteroidales bacterium]|nr:hypothetical protein [Bacteroidales bacterium]